MIVLPLFLTAAIWMWMDFTGLLLSVISTYFYFGWAGTPFLVIWIFLIALFAFSGPLVWRWLAPRVEDKGQAIRVLLMAQFLTYLLVTWIRQPDTFAWLVVAGSFVSSILATASLQQVSRMRSAMGPFLALLLGVLFYLSVRLGNYGVGLLFEPPSLASGSYVSWLILFGVVMTGIALPMRSEDPVAASSAPRLSPWYGLAFGPLIGIGVGLVYNLHIWSAKTPATAAGAYLCSLVIATTLAVLAYRAFPTQRSLLVVAAMAGLGAGLYAILYLPFTLMTGLLFHGLACGGLGLLWLAFFHRYLHYGRQQAHYLPTASLQGGLIIFLLVLAVFLLHSNPGGFWLALLLSGGLIFAAESKSREDVLPLPRIAVFTAAAFLLPGLLAIAAPPQVKVEAPSPNDIRVMSSNIRYGWTDDYRFEPKPQVLFLREHPADITGFQEMNKGHTSGAYMDFYRYYEARLPGYWRYGDANFGFGNALRSRYPIVRSEVRTYQAKDILRRSCLVTTVLIQNREVDVYTTHLSHLPPPNPVREAQAQELVGWLQSSQRPWILIGDFNAHPDAPEIEALQAIAHPVFRQQPQLLQSSTYPSVNPNERIDYIFFSNHFALQRQSILDNQGTSDHRVVESILRFN